MYFVTIDCGTTNTRVSVVDGNAAVLAQASKKVGVRDTAITGSRAVLKAGIRETFDNALAAAALEPADIGIVVASGMITSEIGLIEIPHIWAPATLQDLADNMVKVDDPDVVPLPLPIHFIPGIKNRYAEDIDPFEGVGALDFMRGEEAQVAGLLSQLGGEAPLTAVILSSHTKFVPIDREGRILGSITTLSGQVFEAIVKQTFIGKSIGDGSGDSERTDIEFHIVDEAHKRVREAGFLRTLLMARFLDVLLKTRQSDRRTFIDAAIASDDLRVVDYFDRMGFPRTNRFVIIGSEERCALYRHLLYDVLRQDGEISCITSPVEIASLSIKGALRLTQLAGLL